jgi:hypothetical protein
MSEEAEAEKERSEMYLRFRKTDLKIVEEDLSRQLSFMQDLRTNPRYLDFFSVYSKFSVEMFIDGYAHLKTEYTRNAGPSEDDSENAKMGLTTEAFDSLCEIQQKKIFNVQCRWRAEEINVEGIEACSDFYYWQQYPLACPFVDPITREEVKVYLEYLNSPCKGLRRHWSGEYQFYDRFKDTIREEDHRYSEEEEDGGEAYADDEEEEEEYEEIDGDYEDEGGYPDWYAFCDQKYGTGHLIRLPNVRGEKEDRYRSLSLMQQRQALVNAGNYPPQMGDNQKPYLSIFDENAVNLFVDSFEGLEEKENWQNYRDARNKKDPELEAAFEMLLCTNDIIPMEAHVNWREAMLKAGQLCKDKLVAQAIPFTYEEYLMKLNAGIAFYENMGKEAIEEHRKAYSKDILDGRELSGEPRNFEF